MPQDPLNEQDLDWVKARVQSDTEDRLTGITNSEILWGGPRGKGLVYVVQDLVEATANLAKSVTLVQTENAARTVREEREENLRKIGLRLLMWIFGPFATIEGVSRIYTLLQPIAEAHGLYAPPLNVGVHTH